MHYAFHIILLHNKNTSDSHFPCSWCYYLEGTKDVLCHKFKRLTIGQDYKAVCINAGGHGDAFLNKWHEAPRVSRGLLSRPPSLKRSDRQGLFFVMPIMQ